MNNVLFECTVGEFKLKYLGNSIPAFDKDLKKYEAHTAYISYEGPEGELVDYVVVSSKDLRKSGNPVGFFFSELLNSLDNMKIDLEDRRQHPQDHE